MKLGVMSSGIAPLGWDKALAYCRELGLDAIELPCGAFARSPLIQAEALLNDRRAQQQLESTQNSRRRRICWDRHGKTLGPAQV